MTSTTKGATVTVKLTAAELDKLTRFIRERHDVLAPEAFTKYWGKLEAKLNNAAEQLQRSHRAQ